jgi:hypothetical protein
MAKKVNGQKYQSIWMEEVILVVHKGKYSIFNTHAIIYIPILYIVCFRWRNVLDPNIKKGRWTKEEDEILLSEYEQVKASPNKWIQIAKMIPGRTSLHIQHRYKESLAVNKSGRKWTSEEDELLRKGVEEVGEGKWTEIARKYLPQYTGNQCRSRWTYTLNPNLKKGSWTKEVICIIQSYLNALPCYTYHGMECYVYNFHYRKMQSYDN